MNRQQKRKEIRDLKKELDWIKKNTEFVKLLQAPDLANVTHEDSELLKKNEHPSKRLQERFNRAMQLMTLVMQKQSRLSELSPKKEDFSDI